MIDKNGVIETLKQAHDDLADMHPEIMERIFHDDTILDDKETYDYKVAAAICRIMDVIEQIEEEPDTEELDYDFDEFKYHVKGIPAEFHSEEQMIDYIKALPTSVQRNRTFVMSHSYKGTFRHFFRAGTIAIATPKESE